jgi:hypothetical protein
VTDEFLEARYPYLDEIVTTEEIGNILAKLNTNKVPALPVSWLSFLARLFNKVFISGEVPLDRCCSEVSLLYKKGDKQDPINYRGIAHFKIFPEWLQKRTFL